MIILWDFNGTIIDDVDICLKAEQDILNRLNMGKVVSREEYLELFEFPVIKYYEKIGFDFSILDFNEISKWFIEYYNSYKSEYKLNKDVLQCIRDSVAKNNKNIIISASEQNMLVDQCEILKIDQYFDEICGINNINAHSKIAMAKEWLANNDYNNEEMLFIGDSVHDYQVAEELGVKCILVASGHQSKRKLMEVCDTVYNDFSEVKL
jgi:phosphoglycolate phosphatase